MTVLPRSQPVLHVRVANTGREPYAGQVSVQVPQSWRMPTSSHDVQLKAGEEKRLAFSVAEGNEDADNRYEVEIVARGGGRKVVRRQEIVVASAPYFKPTIDGDPSDWKDAIPITFVVGGKRTTIATYWNRRQFSLLVSVEETNHIPLGQSLCCDAVQLSLSAQGTKTGRSLDELADRFEYLICADEERQGMCCLLAQPGLPLAETGRPRPLRSLLDEQAEVAIGRDESLTHYEISLPLAKVREHIRPSEGREFYLSVLVHDPDGTGLRDWGEAAGLWPSQRNRFAWSNWEGAQWKDEAPMDCRVEWGMCSSRY